MSPRTLAAVRCPRCDGALAEAGGSAAAEGAARETCPGCGLAFERRGGVIDVLGPLEREARAATVEAFYEVAPFPGYAPGDDAASLLDRSRRSSFLRALDAAVPSDGRLLSVGCGTAQVPAFLALAAPRRHVVGIDGCAASLALADGFARRVGIDNLTLVRGDLFDLPVTPGAWDVVSCRGVVHHTPDPWRAIGCVARCVAPGGILLLGYYESLGRAWHGVRQRLARLRGGRPIAALDPVLRRRDLHPDKARAWIRDQYQHPLERWLPTPRVLARLAELGFDWVRSVPPSPAGGLFDGTPRPGRAALLARRLGWLWAGIGDPDAGLVFVVARRRGATPEVTA